MIIKCPKCGARNRIPDQLEPNRVYRCGRCREKFSADITATSGEDEGVVAHRVVSTGRRKGASPMEWIPAMCIALVFLLALTGWFIGTEISVKSKESLGILMYPDSLLQDVAQSVDIDEIGEAEEQLVQLLSNTLEKKGSTLSAPQVGVPKRIIVVKLEGHSGDGLIAMINPEVIEREETISIKEECLSFPRNEHITVIRAERLKVRYWTLQGEEVTLGERGLNAYRIQHGIDHLNGILFTDYSKRFDITAEALAAIGVFLAFLIIKVGTSLLDDDRSFSAARRRTDFVSRITGFSISRSSVTLLGAAALFVLGVVAAEALLYHFDALLGAVLYAVILGLLLIQYKRETNYQRGLFLIALVLVPLYRLGAVFGIAISSIVESNEGLPIFATSFAILIAGVVVSLRITGLTRREIGLSFGNPFPQLLVGLTGIVFGPVLYYLVEPEPIVAEFGWGIAAIAVLIILVGATAEELAFRGVLQTTSMQAFGRSAVLFVSLIFAVIHIGHISGINISIASIPFILAVAVFFSWVVKRTGSLSGVILSHFITNIIFLLVMPNML